MLPRRAVTEALRAVPLTRFQGPLVRAVHAATLYGFRHGPTYEPRPLFDLGPPRSGARFTPPGGAPALYLASDVETSLRELLQAGTSAALKPQPSAKAVVVFTADVRLEAVVDLTRDETLAALGTTRAEMASPWRHRRDRKTPPTHVIGRAVGEAGHIQALRFSSTKGPGDCFMVLTGTIVAPAFVRVTDPESKLVQSIP
jgi:RES domain-containing protein